MTIRRRTLLGAGASLLGLGTLRSSPFEDADRDGLPDALERSEDTHRFLRDLFPDDQFEGLDPDRPELLIDARYIGHATISAETKQFVRDRFRANGIYLQWMDYPERYPLGDFANAYGDRVERILWPIGSYYAEEVEDRLQDIALQVIVLPDSEEEDLEALYSIQQGGQFDGMSFGNRCLVTETDSIEAETILVMHEIGHLALCHSDDPSSVMSPTPEQPHLSREEWTAFRDGLGNIRDTSGFDIALRECLLERYEDDARHILRGIRDRFED